MVIATGSYQLALVAVYFDFLPLEEATDPKFYIWILAYNIIMLPLQLIGFKYLYSNFTLLELKRIVSKKI